MKIIRNIFELKNNVACEVENAQIKIITIDGKDGSGKSTVANELCLDQRFVHVNLDDSRYLDTKKGGYVDYIKNDTLLKDIQKNQGKIIILDGICILEIMSRINQIPDLKIYVKKTDKNGHWYDGLDFDYSRDPEDIIQESENDTKKFMELEMVMDGKKYPKYEYYESIFHELIRYHHNYTPDLNSDIVYENNKQ